MKHLVLLAVLASGCSPQAIRIGAEVIDGLCLVAHSLGADQRPIVAYDVFPDGGVRPVYRETRR